MAPSLGYDIKPVGFTYGIACRSQIDGGLKAGLENFYDSGFSSNLYTDLQVTCQGHSYNVHRVVVCSQSEFFANACKPGSPFPEAKDGVINLEDDDPRLIKTLLAYFYTFDIVLDPGMDRDDEFMPFLIDVYSVAEKFGVQGLKKTAWGMFMDCLDQGRWRHPLFPNVLRKIYETTDETDRGLRNAALSVVKARLTFFMKTPGFKERMDRVEDFWRDLAQYIADFPNLERYKCFYCDKEVAIELPISVDSDTGYSPVIPCAKCNSDCRYDMWKRHVVKGSGDDEVSSSVPEESQIPLKAPVESRNLSLIRNMSFSQLISPSGAASTVSQPLSQPLSQPHSRQDSGISGFRWKF